MSSSRYSLGPLGQPNFDYAILLNAVEEENVAQLPGSWLDRPPCLL